MGSRRHFRVSLWTLYEEDEEEENKTDHCDEEMFKKDERFSRERYDARCEYYDNMSNNSNTSNTITTSNNSSWSSLSDLFTESNGMKSISESIINKRMKIYGMVVQKYCQGGTKKRYRRITYKEGCISLSSLSSTKVVYTRDVTYAKTHGKKLILSTSNHGVITLKMNTVSEALAFRNLME